jgi:hypothetical protein
MDKLLVVTIVVVMVSGLVGIPPMMGGLSDSYATKQSKQAPSEKTTIRPERQTEQPSEASEDTTVRPERQSEFSPEQQEDNDIDLKDEQIRDVQQEEDDNENNGDNDEEQVEIDKKAPIAISGDNVYVVWFNDQNTPNNNSEVLFRSSADSGVTFADRINLSNTTAADSINAEIAADGNNVVITWWERNATGEEPIVRASADNGATFGPMLTLRTNETIGQATE